MDREMNPFDFTIRRIEKNLNEAHQQLVYASSLLKLLIEEYGEDCRELCERKNQRK